MRNIGMILQGKFPPELRGLKEARALTAAGYRVFLLCERGEGQKVEEEREEWVIRRIVLNSGLGEKLNYWGNLLTLRDSYWLRAIKKFMADFELEALHIHDLPLVGTGLQAARAAHLPLVFDRHENWAAFLRNLREDACLGRLHSWKDRTFITPERWQRAEVAWAGSVDKILAVVEEAKEKLIRLGIPEGKIHIVSNTEELDFPERYSPDQELLEHYQGWFIVSYIGGFSPHRGLDTAISALRYLKGRIPNLRLLLVGSSPDNQFNLKLRQTAADLGVADMVEFTGWQPLDRVSSYIGASRICLVPHQDTEHTAATIPHKLFQYMLLSKPVVVSSCPPLARIVTETGCGLVFKAGDDQELADRIYQIYVNPGSYGERGRQAARQKYNWGSDAQELIRVYQELT